MGNSVIWYLPHGASFLERIDFGRKITNRLGPVPTYNTAVSESFSGAQTTVIYGGRSRLTLQHIWTRDAAGTGDRLRRQLLTLQGHLARGGGMIFAEDVDKAVAGFVISDVSAGVNAVAYDYDLFSSIATGSLSGQEIVLSSDHDGYLYEHQRCLLHVATSVAFPGGQLLVQDLSSARWVLVRDYGTWPALRVPAEFRAGLDIVPHEHEWIFTLELPLEEDPQAMEALYALGVPIIGTEVSPMPPIDFDGPIGLDDGIKDPPYGWR